MPLIKICGLRTPETLDAALSSGAEMVGFVRFARSPRHVALDLGRDLSRMAAGRSTRVVLFVDPSDAELDEAVAAMEPDMIQLHGRETPERAAEIGRRTGRPVMKALPVSDAADLSAIDRYRGAASRILLDAKPPKDALLPGGNGIAFDWRLVAGLSRTPLCAALGMGAPDPATMLVLSGGLTPENVAEAIAVSGLLAVDVSSGVESAPGIKDSLKIAAFVRAARTAFAAGDRRVANAPNTPNTFRAGPDDRGMFGIFGGRFVAETLMPNILELEREYERAKADPAFKAEMDGHLAHYVGRPSPLYFAERLTEHLRQLASASGRSGGAKIYLKREELNHTGSHKVNNVTGQIMLARRMGKKRIIAETGAGQHGVATATLCARFGLECIVYMGAVDVERQMPNVTRMRMLGAKVVPVQSGTKTLKDAMNEALRDWVTNVETTFYCIGTVAGRTYPAMVRDFQAIIGEETKEQMLKAEGRLPDSLIACIGGGSNAMGLFHPFLDDREVKIWGVEAAGAGLSGLHAASIAGGRPGVLHGNRTFLLMDDDGQIADAHSISAGLDYPGIGPEHSWLHEMGRVTYISATDEEALDAFQLLSRLEGIIPALEPAHALAKVAELAPTLPRDHLMVVNLSGRGDKDVPQVGEMLAGRL